MTHSYKLHYFHLIWSTKKRLPQISPDVQSRLYPYLEAITRNYSGKILEIGGMPDHVHLLVELSSVDRFSEFIREIKSSSSLWIHKIFLTLTISVGKKATARFLLAIQPLLVFTSIFNSKNSIMQSCPLRKNILNF